VLCQDKKLNNNGRFFLKIKAKNADLAVATASIFNVDIRKKNNISLSSLSSQSNRIIVGIFTIIIA
jgi:hypothetical protein